MATAKVPETGEVVSGSGELASVGTVSVALGGGAGWGEVTEVGRLEETSAGEAELPAVSETGTDVADGCVRSLCGAGGRGAGWGEES